MGKPDPSFRNEWLTRVLQGLALYSDLGVETFVLTPDRKGSPAARKTRQLLATAVRVEAPVVEPEPQASVAEKTRQLQALREEIGDCNRCKLCRGRTTIVFGEGNPGAALMFVGEGPGADEDRTGRPFVGRAGQLLDKMIEAMTLRREDVYIANVVKCRPPENRVPEPDEAAACGVFVTRQIEIIQPRVIVCLGATASQFLFGVKSSMGALRGSAGRFRGAVLVATYHPAYLLRNPAAKKDAWQDLQKAMSLLGLKQRGQ